MSYWPWWVWMIAGFMVWSLFLSPRAHGGCGGGKRRSRSADKSAEVAELKQDLNASLAQIETLKARLEAVETIVTDEEAELRREFRRLKDA